MDASELAAAFDLRRGRLRGIAYRMLGSLAEAEDAVQDAWLRLQRSEPDGIEDLDAWLTTVVARLCLNAIRDRRRHAAEPLDAFHPEPIVSQTEHSDPEHEALLAEAVGVALQVVLDALTPAERMAFVLHDMFAVPFAEIAEMVERSPDATRQLASRARRRVRDAAPLPDASIQRQRDVVDAYFAAAREGDMEALIAVLDPDVVVRAHRRDGPPIELHGSAQVARGAMTARRFAPYVRPALVNGSAGVVAFDDGKPFAVLAFTVVDGKATAIDIFNDPELVPRLLAQQQASLRP
jgi:RNA polymerase sigma-70 factor (ECF subfamily)